jgi:hypothetical protein
LVFVASLQFLEKMYTFESPKNLNHLVLKYNCLKHEANFQFLNKSRHNDEKKLKYNVSESDMFV